MRPLCGTRLRRGGGRGRSLVTAAALLCAGCASLPAAPPGKGVLGRRVTVQMLLAPTVNLHDRAVATLAVREFAGAEGPALANDLAAALARRQVFAVVGPRVLEERLLRLGLAVGWESTASNLRWSYERAGVDAVVVGRLEIFAISDREKAQDVLTAVETGEYGFTLNDEGKLAYREKVELRQVPLYCRTALGTVAASYRVWDTRRGELVATVHHQLSTEVPSFCYRDDVPVEVEHASQQRLLRRLFADLNEQFLADILPIAMRGELEFLPLPGGAGGALVQSNELAILCASRNDWERAVDLWQDALRARPDLAALHYNLGLAYRATSRPTRAREHLEKAVNLAPREPLYRQALQARP